MKQNKYDDDVFFGKYRALDRSRGGLEAAGEWHELERMLPDFRARRVLDLGCGFGWHCRYAAEHGAASVIGIDISENMLRAAREKTAARSIQYIRMAIEDFDFPANSFDAVISSLALHYVGSFEPVANAVGRCLARGGKFVFSVEHPVFTAGGPQQWHVDGRGNRLHWPVDRYFEEGARHAVFLGEQVIKYHRTVATYLNGLIRAGFTLTNVVEPAPAEDLLRAVPGMADELRRPGMLLVAARKEQ
jgi:SAM-dependent methyltransferase